MKHDFRSHVSCILRDQMSLFCATGPDVRANNKSDRISENLDSTSQKQKNDREPLQVCNSNFKSKSKLSGWTNFGNVWPFWSTWRLPDQIFDKTEKNWATQTNFWPTAHLANFWKTSNRLIDRFLRKFGPTHDQPINHFLFWNTQKFPRTRPETLSLREGDLTVPVVEKLL